MEEFKDACWGLDVRSEEIAADLRDLPTDYKLAERYIKIDQEIYEMFEWYERVKKFNVQYIEFLQQMLEQAKQDKQKMNNG